MMSYYTPYSALQDLLRHYNANKRTKPTNCL